MCFLPQSVKVSIFHSGWTGYGALKPRLVIDCLMKMKCYVLFLAFLLYNDIKEAYTCSCPIGAFQKSREESICESYTSGYTENVYEATVEAAYCKCFPDTNSTTTFSCIQYSDGNGDGVAEGTAESTYECTRNPSLQYDLSSCSDVTETATGSDGIVI